jgi:hypothetical protein
MGRMRCIFGGRRVRKRNPFYPVHPVHPVKKVLSGEAAESSGLDGVSAHRGGSMRKSLIFPIFVDICRYFQVRACSPKVGFGLCKSLISMKVSDNLARLGAWGARPSMSRRSTAEAVRSLRNASRAPLPLRGWIHVVMDLLRTGNILASLS